jgi:hypothetical protein
MRAIPVVQSIESHPETMPYEQVRAVVDAHGRFAASRLGIERCK